MMEHTYYFDVILNFDASISSSRQIIIKNSTSELLSYMPRGNDYRNATRSGDTNFKTDSRTHHSQRRRCSTTHNLRRRPLRRHCHPLHQSRQY